jgi:hypothetical protein
MCGQVAVSTPVMPSALKSGVVMSPWRDRTFHRGVFNRHVDRLEQPSAGELVLIDPVIRANGQNRLHPGT